MNRFLKDMFYVVSGISIGATVTWAIAKQRYEKRIQEEVESVKEAYNRKAKELADKNTTTKESITLAHPDKTDYSEYDTESKEYPEEIVVLDEDASIDNFMSTSLGNYAMKDVEPKKDSVEQNDAELAPEIIDISDFGEKDDYTQTTLYFYINNKILTDDQGSKIDDPETLIGEEALNKLKTDEYINELYLDDSLNHKYYEILIDESDYYSDQEL